jgi:hypothetical protein
LSSCWNRSSSRCSSFSSSFLEKEGFSLDSEAAKKQLTPERFWKSIYVEEDLVGGDQLILRKCFGY